jgi:hypothetical protein
MGSFGKKCARGGGVVEDGALPPSAPRTSGATSEVLVGLSDAMASFRNFPEGSSTADFADRNSSGLTLGSFRNFSQL